MQRTLSTISLSKPLQNSSYLQIISTDHLSKKQKSTIRSKDLYYTYCKILSYSPRPLIITTLFKNCKTAVDLLILISESNLSPNITEPGSTDGHYSYVPFIENGNGKNTQEVFYYINTYKR